MFSLMRSPQGILSPASYFHSHKRQKRDWDKVSVDWWICRYKFQPTLHICSVQAVWRSPRCFNLNAARCKTSLYRWKFHAREAEPLGWYKVSCRYWNALDLTKWAPQQDKLNKTSKSTNNKDTRILWSSLPSFLHASHNFLEYLKWVE